MRRMGAAPINIKLIEDIFRYTSIGPQNFKFVLVVIVIIKLLNMVFNKFNM